MRHPLCSYPPPTTIDEAESTSPSNSAPTLPIHHPNHDFDTCFVDCRIAAVLVNLFVAISV